MIDNFNEISKLLEFPNDQTFYFIQILQRKKDHAQGTRLGGSNNNSRLIKAYYITSVEHFFMHKEEMIKLCEVFNARACINLNPRNFEKAAFQLLQKVANQMSNKDFYGIRKAYDSVLGNYHNEMDKRWLVDIDTKMQQQVDIVEEWINDYQRQQISNNKYKVIARIETKNGWHLITNPFNLDAFQKVFGGQYDVHKNNPTLLYCI